MLVLQSLSNVAFKRFPATLNRWLSFVGLLCFISIFLAGCTRSIYRQKADADAYRLVHEKTNDERWPLRNYTINIDPRSRMYDPYDPDHEPLPPDDPTAHEFMHEVYGMTGYACWHCDGDTDTAENPEWMHSLPMNEKGQVLVDLPTAVKLGFLHSRDYQKELEDLYLSALDVSFERFRFDVQYFAGNSTFYNADGRLRSGSGGDSSSELTTTTSGQANKLFSGGGQLMVELANSIVWQFSGPETNANATLLDFSLVQPLLRGGVKSRVLERLTLTERTLLGNVRLMERYRRGYYVQLVTGREPGQGPARRGGVLGAGLNGFTGLGGGFNNLSTNVNQTINANSTTGGAGAGVAQGFFGLLQTQMQLRNQEANVAALAESLSQLQSAYDAGRIDRFQVDFGRQALFNARSQLLTSKTTFQNTLDNYKVNLGLPPHLEFLLNDPLLAPFQLIDPQIPPMQNRLTVVQEEIGKQILGLRESVPLQGPIADEALVRKKLDTLWQLLQITKRVEKQAERHFASVQADIGDVKGAIPERRQMLNTLLKRGVSVQSRVVGEAVAANNTEASQSIGTDAEKSQTEADDNSLTSSAVNDKQPNTPDNDEFELRIVQLEGLPTQLTKELKTLAQTFSRYPQVIAELETALSELRENPQQISNPAGRAKLTALLIEMPDEVVNLSGHILELSLIQARARSESVTLLPIEMKPEDALAIASRNRRDWMNARANLVDTWRSIEFNANDLESNLNLTFAGDVTTTGDNPVKFDSATGRLRVGVQFDAPITRIAERNNYRQALLEYQQARRSYYNFVDRINQTLRVGLRQIELDQANFELRRAAVRVAIDQVEVSRLRLKQPPKPGEVSTFSPTTARDLVSSLSDLLNVQNDFMSVWVNYEVERVNLDYNLETMELDECGIWQDPGSAVGLNGLQMLQNVPEDNNWMRAIHEEREEIEALKPEQKAPVTNVTKPTSNRGSMRSEAPHKQHLQNNREEIVPEELPLLPQASQLPVRAGTMVVRLPANQPLTSPASAQAAKSVGPKIVSFDEAYNQGKQNATVVAAESPMKNNVQTVGWIDGPQNAPSQKPHGNVRPTLANEPGHLQQINGSILTADGAQKTWQPPLREAPLPQ